VKQKLLIFGAFILLAIVLVGLNAASYVQKEKQMDTEMFPNRSTYNAGATGTRVFYELLSETGRNPVRWQEPPGALLTNKNAPQTFVITGAIKREFTDAEAKDLLQWVSRGGKLVIIDREPPRDLVATTANWSISLSGNGEPPAFDLNPSDAAQMTAGIPAVKPAQPTVYTKNVNAVQPSKFASSVIFKRYSDGEKPKNRAVEIQGIGIGSDVPAPPPPAEISPTPSGEDFFNEEQLKPAPTPKFRKPPTVFENQSGRETDPHLSRPEPASNINSVPPIDITADAEEEENIQTPALHAPFVHLAGDGKNLLVDAPFGSGRIVYLADPFVVSNAGINLVDNAQAAINVVAARGGAVAFDEYHQGYGTNNNRLLQYFADTPVIAIFLQIALFAALVFFSQSRRFARALPDAEPNRLSKLEYVAAMAELQRRTKAFDLAIENIYTDFRRRAARLVGADVFTTSRTELARMIAERAALNEFEIADLMRKCEDVMHGEPTNKKEVLRLASRLREIEEKLGLKRSSVTKIS
jgi:hypothetical protein